MSVRAEQCAHCGSVPEVYVYSSGMFQVRCTFSRCRAVGPWFNERAEAVAAWNRAATNAAAAAVCREILGRVVVSPQDGAGGVAAFTREQLERLSKAAAPRRG